MKIDFLVRWLPPKIDGVGDYTWNLACALRQAGVGVRIFTSTENASAQDGWIFPVIPQWQPEAVIKALENIIGSPPEWLCFQYVPQLYGRWGICWQVAGILQALKRKFRSKVAVVFHEFIYGRGLNPKEIFLATVSRLQTRRLLSVPDLAITTCSRYRDYLRRAGPPYLPVEDIPVGACIEPGSVSPEALAELRRQHFPATAKVLGLFSRLDPLRNFPLALETLQRARHLGLDAWLYVIGNIKSPNPRLFEELLQLAKKLKVEPHVIISGELPKREDLSLCLRMMDVFLFAQIDGISTRNTTLMAALAHGLPVLSFKPCAGNFDGFKIPCNILVERNDREGFIQAALECLRNSENLSRSALANRDYYLRHFSWPTIAQEYLKILGD